MSARDHNATTGRWQKGNTAARKRGVRGMFDSGRLPRAAKSVQRGVALLRRELLGELRRQGCDVDGRMPVEKRLLLQNALRAEAACLLASWWLAKDDGASLTERARLQWQSVDYSRRRDALVARLLGGQGLAAEPEPADPLGALLGRAGQQGDPNAAREVQRSPSEVQTSGNEVREPEPANNGDGSAGPAGEPGGDGEPAPGELPGQCWGWLGDQGDVAGGLGDR